MALFISDHHRRLRVFTDPDTGCEYVGNYGLGLTARLDKIGNQLGCPPDDNDNDTGPEPAPIPPVVKPRLENQI